MKRIVLTMTALSLAVLAGPVQPIDACTGFSLSGDKIRLMAVNYDWDVPGGRLIVNPRPVEKTALVGPDATPAYWVSKFGSVTLNQYGRDFPIGGMNEMGLAMQTLWLEATQWPEGVKGPGISALQWVQYCLDNFLTVKEVADSATRFNISSPASLHFLACDRSGSCAVIEFLDGKAVIRAGDELPLPVLANSTYEASIEALDASLGYGGKVVPAEGEGSLTRFVRAATLRNNLTMAGSDQSVEQAFGILGDVAIAKENQWRVVYDLRSNIVYYTTRGNAQQRRLDLKDVDFHCFEGGVRSVDLSAPGTGDVTSKLAPFTTSDNTNLVRSSISQTGFLKDMPETQILELAKYPDSLSCTVGPRRPTPTPRPGESSPVRE